MVERQTQSCRADGEVLTHHGARQFDHGVASLKVLEEVMSGKGTLKVMINSGIRCGMGALHAIKLMKDEVDRDAAMLEVRRFEQSRREPLRRMRKATGQ